MASKPKEKVKELMEGIEALGKADSERMQPFMAFVEASLKAGALDSKTKQLILVALSLYARCEHCIAEHIQEALKAGASREELTETAFLSGLMGGGPVIACSATVGQDAINTFASDYGK